MSPRWRSPPSAGVHAGPLPLQPAGGPGHSLPGGRPALPAQAGPGGGEPGWPYVVAGQARGGHQPSSWAHSLQAVPGKVGLGVSQGGGSGVAEEWVHDKPTNLCHHSQRDTLCVVPWGKYQLYLCLFFLTHNQWWWLWDLKKYMEISVIHVYCILHT